MCESETDYRFCTCGDAEPLVPPMWTLERRDQNLAEQNMRGKVATPQFTDDELTTREALLSSLTRGECFDFDYQPQNGDVFIVKYHADRPAWRYRFDSSIGPAQWNVDSSSQLTRWRTQMVHVGAGPIKVVED